MSSPIHSDMINPRDSIDDKSIIQTGLGPTTDRIVTNIVDKINTPAIKETINDKIIDPLKTKMTNVIRPYLYIGGFMYLIIILLLIFIIVILLKKQR